jgi:multicomponent Na+:H+ antiporter subunit F
VTHDLVFTVGAIWLTVLLVACALLVLRARSTSSRILALDTLVLMLIGMLVLWSDAEEVSWFLDAALALSVLGFVATLAAAHFHSSGRLFP